MAKIIFKLKRNVGYNQFIHAVGNDELRPTMTGVMFNPKESELACTDAHILTIYPIEVYTEKEVDFTASIPVFLFNRSHYYGYDKGQVFKMTDFWFVVDTERLEAFVYAPSVFSKDEFDFSLITNNYLIKVPLIEGKIPDYNSVFPTKEQATELSDIGLNLHYLKKLEKSLKEVGAKSDIEGRFKFRFNGKNRAVVLSEINEDSSAMKGLVMPILYE